jgi:hypothetical protein
MKTIFATIILTVGLSATTVTSITCSGQTATVNATAHGLVASQGFSLSGTAATFNSTTSTVTTNALAFVLPSGTACSNFTSGYTTIVPAKQIIELGATASAGNATVILNYVYWFTTQFPNPLPSSTVSVWSGASAAETAAIVAGTTVEIPGQLSLPATTTATGAQTAVTAQYNATQTGFANFLLAGGYFWNGLTWANH